MFKSLYTVSEKYKDRNLVIYGINRTSVMLFAKLALNHQADISAFWDAEGRFAGECFMNRRIISTGELRELENAAVIIPKILDKCEVQKQADNRAEMLYADEILDLNEELRGKRIYIYGIGAQGGIIHDRLIGKGIKIEDVCITKPGRTEVWCGKKVLPVEDIEDGGDCAVIIATDIESYRNEMLERIRNYNAEKYVPDFMSKSSIEAGNFFQVINIALSKRKGIWLYSRGSEGALYLDEVLERYSVDVAERVDDESIYNLEYEDIENISVIIADEDSFNAERICDVLDDIGFALEHWNYASITDYTIRVKPCMTKSDVLLGWSMYDSEKYPGYVVYGDDDKAKTRIMVLGGSTSTDGRARTVSWVRFLYEMLSEAGYNTIIFNGAASGQGITDEFLRMLRDIEPLRPDYVISFSGVNDTYKKKAGNLFNLRISEAMTGDGYIKGIQSDETLYDFWCRISKLIKLTAEYHGAKTYSFLQPMDIARDDWDLIETTMFDYTEHTQYARHFKARALAENERFYTNMISMFEGQRVYIDAVHYSTEANKMIAERIFEVIDSDIKKR